MESDSSVSNWGSFPMIESYADEDDGENVDDSEELGDDQDETDAMAIALSPHQSPKPVKYGREISVVQRANHCTVYESSNVLNTYQSINPDEHNKFIKQGHDFLKTKVKQLKPVYVESMGARECMDILETENSLFIKGIAGEGKTTTGIMAMNKLAKTGYQPIIITSPKDWNSKVVLADENEKLVLFIDDMFGTASVDENKVNEWIAMNEIVHQLLVKRNGSLKIICIVRRKIYKATQQRLRRFKWFKTFRMVDISGTTYSLNERERIELLQKHFKHYNVPREKQCLAAAKSNPPHGFAHCVELYCTEQHCLRMGISFFSSPLSALERELQILYETKSTQYYALILIRLSNGQKITAEKMSGEEEFDGALLNRTRLLSKMKTKDGTDIVRAIEKMTDNYLREEEDGSVSFRHNTVSEMVGVIATKNSPIPAVNYLDMPFLSEKTKLVSYKEDDKDEVAILPKKCTFKLAIRLTEALFKGEAFSACKHQAWDNVVFVQTWLDYCQKNESTSRPGNTFLDDLMTTPLECYQIMQRNSSPVEIHVGIMFLLYLNKKEMAREEIMKLYNKQAMEENEKLSKFRKEQRCPSGRKLKHFSDENTTIN